jgi:N-acetylglucosaminyldiphosphoundecaprenol N-acetyl-beta-D-mannosaminyltransferase
MRKVDIFHISVNLLTAHELTDAIVDKSIGNQKSIIGNVNIKALNLAYENKQFADFFQKCDLIYIDGYGPLLGAKILGYNANNEHRNSCPDFLDTLLDKLEKTQQKIFFLGNSKEVVARLPPIFSKRHPELNYKAHHGYFKKSGQPNRDVINKINAFGPHVLFIGFGMPLQEYWILENYEKIDARVFLPEGACLDFYTDSTFRAPNFLTDNGLEWLARLFTEPKRLWKRYLLGNPKFIYRIYRQKFGYQEPQ